MARDTATNEHDHHEMAESGAAEHGAHDNAAHEQGAHDQGAHEHSAHEHSAHDPARFKRLFWITLVLTIPTLVFSTGLQDILGLSGPRFPGSQFIPAAFGLAIFVIGGRIFLQGAWHELRVKSPGMMTLISLALVVAFGYSAAVTLGFEGMDFWWELSTLVVIMLLGHWIEMSAVMGAQNALGELAKLVPDTAERVRDAEHAAPDAESERVPTAELRVGDLLIVRPGERVPADGEIVDGEAELDESLLTGESAAVAKSAGDTVIGGSVVAGGALVIKVAKLGDDTALAGIMRLVSDAQTSKSGQQLLADRVAALLFYVAVAAAVITLLVWYLLMPDDPAFVINRVVTVLVIACPHALGLAIPLVAQLSTSIGAQRGILIRERAALETAREIDVVVFDKTGTLTRGELALSRWVPSPGQDEQEILRLAGAVESRSEHPIARAIVTAARSRRLKLGRPKGFTALAGRGASAIVDGRELRVVSGRQITAAGLRLENGMVNVQRELAAKGHTLVYLAEGDQVLGLFALADAVREESAEAVKLLKQRGIRVAMMTGDSHAVADWVAAELGIDEVYAEVLPEQKAATVARIQNGGMHRVAMVGDGVNDAPALAQADLGLAMGTGTDVAIEASDITLVRGDLRSAADAIRLSRKTLSTIKTNLFWAFAYNTAAIPIAALGLLNPMLAGAAMAFSSVFVVGNSLRLRGFKSIAR